MKHTDVTMDMLRERYPGAFQRTTEHFRPERGQGRRRGGMITGGMSARIDRLSYFTDPWGDFPQEVRDDIGAVFTTAERIEYMRYRYVGLSHDEAADNVFLNMEVSKL